MIDIKQRSLPTTLPSLKNVSPLLTKIYAARGITCVEQLDTKLSQLLPPTFKCMEQAVNVLKDALMHQQRILIIGDFDADGATATVVAVQGLKMMGFKSVDFLVPNRFEYGYGLTPEIVELARQKNPDMIITVDNGISSFEGVLAAHRAGIKVMITDHHLPSDQLPEADVIINPNLKECPFPSKMLAGVGVVFYVLIAFRALLRKQQWFSQQQIEDPNLASLLDLVALGTVADIVPLDDNNRRLVQQGVMRIRCHQSRPGIHALLQLAGKEAEQITAQDLGFLLAPRLNAAGRLDDMALGINCLLCEDETLVHKMATQLNALNEERKLIEQSMAKEASEALESISLTTIPSTLCLFNEHWHQGVIGILAARLKEKYHRPVIVFARSETKGMLKGSARSITGVHVRDVLEHIANKYPHLLDKFGGHAMAAGLSLPEQHYELFSQVFNQVVSDLLTEEMMTQVFYTDGYLLDHELSLETAKQLMHALPWGRDFPEPSFEGVFTVKQLQILKDKHIKLQLETAGHLLVEALAFNSVDKYPAFNKHIKTVRLVYRLAINHFRGQEKLQLIIQHLTYDD